MNVLTLAIELLFLVLFVTTLISYVRRRDALSRDVMLIFGSVAALFATIGVNAITGRLPDPVLGAALALLLAQPLFTLRLANQLRPVPRPVWLAAIGAWGVTSIPFIAIQIERLAFLFLPATFVFAATHLVAAFFLAREGRRRVGSARVRLAVAAGAGVSMALALALLVFGSAIPGAANVGNILALGAATLYVLAFMPPAWVRKVWSAVASFEFMQTLSGTQAQDTVTRVWTRTAELARRTTGASMAMVVAGEPTRLLAVDREPGIAEPTESFDLVPEPVFHDRPLTEADGQLGAFATAMHAPYASVVRFSGADNEPGAVILLRPRPSLFKADDLRIVRSLVDQATVFAQRSEAQQETEALADRLAVTVQALERASQAKSDFLASMSHELRTPLSAIIGFSALMRDEPLDSDRRAVPDEWIQHVHRSGEHLLSLINDVLDLTKIEAGRIQLERETFDLGTALVESVEGLRPLADRKRIEMIVDQEAGSIVADRGRLRQIVYNLLSNAIKFTPDGGRICVESRWDGDTARIAVIDNGVGVAADDLGRIFDEFSQVGDLKAREAGTGLGLALSRRLAEAHGGELHVSSELGVGSRFELVLPESRAVSEARTASAIAPTPTAVGTSVLVIEDDPGAVRLLRTYLESEGYDAVIAADGESGIAAARASAPAAIILDVLLPGMDGWEVLRRLKADPELRDVPVVVVTVVDERNVAMSLGAADYFLKPV
ncbi:MAG TPA: ATP-binding protein, partial [Candidatus Limnocylindria bacterium]|nr:ATP-binding protein [Candidatus Limnocylindria bacterium]